MPSRRDGSRSCAEPFRRGLVPEGTRRSLGGGPPMFGRSTAWRRRRRALSLVVAGLAATLVPASAQASWPGLNGWLSFSSNRFDTALSGDIFVMPSFGLPQAQLTDARPDDAQSAWSPDGRRIAFK